MYEQLVPFKIWKHKTWCTDPVRPSGANFKESTHRIQQTWTAISNIAQAASPGYVYTQYGIVYGFLNSANQTSFNDNGNPPFKPTNIPDQQNPGPPPRCIEAFCPKRSWTCLGRRPFFKRSWPGVFAPVEGGRPCRIGYRQMTALNELMAQTGSCLAIGIPLANSTEFWGGGNINKAYPVVAIQAFN